MIEQAAHPPRLVSVRRFRQRGPELEFLDRPEGRVDGSPGDIDEPWQGVGNMARVDEGFPDPVQDIPLHGETPDPHEIIGNYIPSGAFDLPFDAPTSVGQTGLRPLGIGLQCAQNFNQVTMTGPADGLLAQGAQGIFAVLEMPRRHGLEAKQHVLFLAARPLGRVVEVARCLLQGRFQGREVLFSDAPGQRCDPPEDRGQIVRPAPTSGARMQSIDRIRDTPPMFRFTRVESVEGERRKLPESVRLPTVQFLLRLTDIFQQVVGNRFLLLEFDGQVDAGVQVFDVFPRRLQGPGNTVRFFLRFLVPSVFQEPLVPVRELVYEVGDANQRLQPYQLADQAHELAVVVGFGHADVLNPHRHEQRGLDERRGRSQSGVDGRLVFERSGLAMQAAGRLNFLVVGLVAESQPDRDVDGRAIALPTVGIGRDRRPIAKLRALVGHHGFRTCRIVPKPVLVAMDLAGHGEQNRVGQRALAAAVLSLDAEIPARRIELEDVAGRRVQTAEPPGLDLLEPPASGIRLRLRLARLPGCSGLRLHVAAAFDERGLERVEEFRVPGEVVRGRRSKTVEDDFRQPPVARRTQHDGGFVPGIDIDDARRQ